MESLEQRGRRLILQGYSDQFVKMAKRCTTWLFWHVPDEGTKRKILNSGTVFIIDLGTGPFGVTAGHVIEGLIKDKSNFSDLICQIGNSEIDPSDRLLGINISRDIATFRITSKEISSLNLVPHVDPGPWPPRSPQEGKGAFFGGFRLGEGKGLNLQELYPFDFWHGFGPLKGVYDQQLKIHFERQYWVHRMNHPEPPEGADWGGVSGGPLFALFENPVVFYQLVGVISQYSSNLELLVAKPAIFIKRNGDLMA